MTTRANLSPRRVAAPQLIAVAFAIACIAACGGPGNKLGGSISESLALDFDDVQVRKQNDTLLIEYIKEFSTGTRHKVCKLVVETDKLPLEDGSVLAGEVFDDYVTISRVAGPATDFPPLKSGQLSFRKFEFRAGGTVSGKFEGVFENGRTLYGNFEQIVEVVDTD